MDESREVLTERASSWNAAWREALGPAWQWQLALFASLLFTAGALLPFADPDLSIHLATGEWIARHHGVPFVEPFAWTRAGAPFQAYSWAIETLYFVLISRFGPVGLSVLQGVVYVLLAAVMLVLGRAAGWRPWTVILAVFANLVVALGTTAYVRPQSILLIILPLIWALVYRALRTDRLTGALVGLLLASTILANTHLLFPLAAAPCVLLLIEPPADRKRIVLVPLAIAAGWMISPYALHWPAVFSLNFAPNAIFGPPTPINEYKPGFLMVFFGGNSSFSLAVLFALLPWAAAPRLEARARTLYGLMWLAGLLMFALAARSLVVWWLLIIPPSALAVDRIGRAMSPVVRTTQRAIVHAVFALIAIQAVDMWLDPSLRAGGMSSRYLPSINAQSIEPLAKWLDCFTRPSGRGRVVTTFNFGGYVPWRLPYLSESIDGRVIFADSVSRPEAYVLPRSSRFALPPWRTADVAIFPVDYAIAAILDTAKGWHRVAMTNQREGPSRLVGIWVTESWWMRAGRIPLPGSAMAVMQTREPRRASCADILPAIRTTSETSSRPD